MPSVFSGFFKNNTYHIYVPSGACGGVLTALFLRHFTLNSFKIAVHPLRKISPITPSFVRTHFKNLSLNLDLLYEYEHFLDLAEICAQTQNTPWDFSCDASKLHALFHSTHPVVLRTELYQKLVQQIYLNPNVEALFDADPIYSALLSYAEQNPAVAQISRKVPAQAQDDTEQINALSRFLNPKKSRVIKG